MEVGNPNFTNCRNSDNSVSQGDAADMFNVSRDTVNCAAKVIDGAEPEIIELCDNGRMAASAAASIADAPAEFQKKVAELIETGEAKSGKDAIRLARRAEVAEIPDLPTGKYRVIYADPPWKYGDELTENYGATRYHYPPQTITELCELGIDDVTEENAVLFLWVTSPALRAVAGFEAEVDRSHLAYRPTIQNLEFLAYRLEIQKSMNISNLQGITNLGQKLLFETLFQPEI